MAETGTGKKKISCVICMEARNIYLDVTDQDSKTEQSAILCLESSLEFWNVFSIAGRSR
jgi:hypothetical protein